jgi:hypothetical protein
MIRASELQETEAILYLAQTYDKGVDGLLFVFHSYIDGVFFDLTDFREQNWKQAVDYYERYIHIRENEANIIDEDSGTNEPNQTNTIHNGISFHDQHDIVARLATLYETGGFNLLCNCRKAGKILFVL